jgi:ABC-type branched-subunit amino acid transport system substrate-binding protein
MRRGCHFNRVATLASAAIAGVLVLTGCGAGGQGPTDPLQREPGHVHLYGSDGNMLNAVGDRVTALRPDALAGMKGTTPLTPLTQSFKNRLLSIDTSLVDVTYAGETYDAVVISALAAQIARTTDPKKIAAQVTGVTVGGDECDTPAQCLDLIDAGRNIRYRGITLGFGGFTDVGEPSASLYGILRFGAGNRLADSLTQFVPAGNPTSASQTQPPSPGSAGSNGAPLRVGALLPHTGGLASAGPPMFAAGKLAVKEINDAGGVLGQPVQWVDGDDGTDPEVAKATVERLVEEEHVQVIIGAAASGVSLAVLPLIKEKGVVMISPSNTSAELTTADDGGLYFRTAPPDGLQAAALADIIVRDGTRKLAVIYRDDSYGTGLANSTKESLVAAGLSADDITLYSYTSETGATLDLGGTAAAVRALDPDGVLVIAFDETDVIIDALATAGISSITN